MCLCPFCPHRDTTTSLNLHTVLTDQKLYMHISTQILYIVHLNVCTRFRDIYRVKLTRPTGRTLTCVNFGSLCRTVSSRVHPCLFWSGVKMVRTSERYSIFNQQIKYNYTFVRSPLDKPTSTRRRTVINSSESKTLTTDDVGT